MLLFLSHENLIIYYYKISQTSHEVEALQPMLMVMLGSHNLVDISKLHWIHIFTYNSFLDSIPFFVSSFLKDFQYFQVDIDDLQDNISDVMKDSCFDSPFLCGSLVLD